MPVRPCARLGEHRRWLLPSLVALALGACNNAADDTSARAQAPDSNCHVQLFARPGFKGVNVFVRGAGEYPRLDELPDAGPEWNDSVASFKTGARAVVTFWPQPDFEGAPLAGSNGRTQAATMATPRSMKVACKGGAPAD